MNAGTPGAGTAEDRAAFQKGLDALSTDRTLNPNRNFDSADAAATEVLNATAGLSKQYGLEVAGSIWKSKGGWRYTAPEIGGVGSASLTTGYIGYHTHPSGGLMFSNQFNNHSYSGGGDAGWVAASGSEGIVLGLSGFRNFTKLATNPALWFNSSLRSAHVVPASVRLQNAGSVQALASKIGSTNRAVDATLIPLTPFIGGAFND